jgi:hypothetical protein
MSFLPLKAGVRRAVAAFLREHVEPALGTAGLSVTDDGWTHLRSAEGGTRYTEDLVRAYLDGDRRLDRSFPAGVPGVVAAAVHAGDLSAAAGIAAETSGEQRRGEPPTPRCSPISTRRVLARASPVRRRRRRPRRGRT